VDFDLHGFVGVRCVDATPGDLAAVSRQLGLLAAPLDREPDIRIRFVDRFELSSPLRTLEVDDVAFSDDAFFVLRGKHKSRSMVQIPFDAIGGPCEIVCQRGSSAVPLLIDVVNATALGRNRLPLHAAAFEYDGVGALVTGWSKGGKTEALLAFMSQGARYVGDEWVYLDEGGRRMFGIPEPIRIWSWHLEHLPAYRARLGRRKRLELRAIGAGVQGAKRAIGSGLLPSRPQRFLARLLPLLQRQLHVDWPPADLFGASSLALSAALDRVFFVGCHELPEIRVEPIAAGEVADRMLFSLEAERERLMACYRKFRFAFPERANPLIEGARELQRALLSKALEGRKAYAVYHPYPVEIPALFEAMRFLLR
jgi:hypothetical protein